MKPIPGDHRYKAMITDEELQGLPGDLEDGEMSVRTITPQELEDLRRQGRGVDLIDVRTPVEYREVHAEAARSVPLDRLDPGEVMEARNGSRDEPLYTICRSGSRGR
ncbi:rhodanese-like domain-containing protein, partial [Singulisphaera rosea]